MQVTRNVKVQLDLPSNPRAVLEALAEFGDPTDNGETSIGFVIRNGLLTIETQPRKRQGRAKKGEGKKGKAAETTTATA